MGKHLNRQNASWYPCQRRIVEKNLLLGNIIRPAAAGRKTALLLESQFEKEQRRSQQQGHQIGSNYGDVIYHQTVNEPHGNAEAEKRKHTE